MGGRGSGRDKITPEKKEAVLDALMDGATMGTAAARAGVHRSTVYRWREADETFEAKLTRALDIGTDALEDEATRRGVEGTERPVFHKGQVCGYVRDYSDVLLMFILKARRPEKYRDRYQAPPKPAGKSGFIIVPEKSPDWRKYIEGWPGEGEGAVAPCSEG